MPSIFFQYLDLHKGSHDRRSPWSEAVISREGHPTVPQSSMSLALSQFFTTGVWTKDKERPFKITKGPVCHKNIKIINIHTSINKNSKYMKKKLTELVEDRQTQNSSWRVYHNSLKNDRITR